MFFSVLFSIFAIMEYNTIIQSIGTLGFPVVMCVLMCFYIWKHDEKNAAQIAALKDAVNNNSAIIQQLNLLITRLLNIKK